jgi:uridine phosphorylase
METSAIYGLGNLLGHHCLSLNAVVADRVNKEFSKDAATTIDRLISTSLEIMSAVL